MADQKAGSVAADVRSRTAARGPSRGAGLSRKHIFDACHQSLRRLGVDYIDLYQLHAPDKDAPLEETLRAFEDLVRMGKVRYVGYSNYDRNWPLDREVLELQKQNGWDGMISSQPRWSLVDRIVEKTHVPLCRKWGVGLLVYSPLAQGVLTNKYAGGAIPEGSRAASKFAHFLTQENALTPENVAAAMIVKNAPATACGVTINGKRYTSLSTNCTTASERP